MALPPAVHRGRQASVGATRAAGHGSAGVLSAGGLLDGLVDGAEHALSGGVAHLDAQARSEEHTSELQSLMRISYAVFCFKKKNTYNRSSLYNTKQKLKHD